MIVAFLEVLLPLAVGIAAVVSLARCDDGELDACVRRCADLALAAAAVALCLSSLAWLVLPQRTPARWAEMQLLWLAPLLFWAGVALLVSRWRGRSGRKGRRLARQILSFSALFAFAIGLGWFSALMPVQLMLLAPRELSWPVAATVPVGEWLEGILPALTTFHGRMDGWARNRVLLCLAGALLAWAAYGRIGWREAGRRDLVRGVAASVAAVLAVSASWVALGAPSDCRAWRLGWCEGRIETPIDARFPDRGAIRISYMIRPASGARTPDGVVVAAVGGPSAASAARFMLVGALGDIAKRHDVLVSDYRGFGRSGYAGCAGVGIGAAQERAVEGCLDRLGPLAAALSARHASDDLEAVRRTLAIDRWDLYGESYGTFFAQAYAQAYPASVRSLILDSALPLYASPDYGFMVSRIGEARAPGRRPDAGQSASASALGLEDIWRETVEEARRARGQESVLQGLAIIQLMSMWPDIEQDRVEALRLPPDRRGQALAELSAKLRQRVGGMRDNPIAGLVPPDATVPYACNDYSMPFPPNASRAERERAARDYAREHFGARIAPFTWDEFNEATQAVNGLRVDGFVYEACLFWRYAGMQAWPRPAALPLLPVLVISGSEDFTTTPAMAAEIGKAWKQAKIVNVVGGDHFVLLDPANACARDAALAFIEDPDSAMPAECAGKH